MNLLIIFLRLLNFLLYRVYSNASRSKSQLYACDARQEWIIRGGDQNKES